MIPDLFEAMQGRAARARRHGAGRLRATRRGTARRRPAAACGGRAISTHGHTWRRPDVGYDDQLRYRRVGQRSHRVLLRRLRSGERPAPVTAVRSLRHSRHVGGGEGGIWRLCAGRVSDQHQPGARFSLHQDKNEEAFEAPIVSVSLGLPAILLFGSMHRADTTRRVPLTHGDLVVWGGAARLRYHGVLLLKGGQRPLMDGYRIKPTLRKAL